jgi:hypothetical protein
MIRSVVVPLLEDMRMRHTRPLLLVVLAVVALAPRALRAQQPFSERDRADIAALLTRMVATARQAWNTRNASLLVPDSAVSVRTPQGGTLTATQLRADLQRRMDIYRGLRTGRPFVVAAGGPAYGKGAVTPEAHR